MMKSALCFLLLSSGHLTFASRPPSKPCTIKAKIESINSLSEVTGNGASVEMTVEILKSSCQGKLGKRRIQFYWNPAARFKHRLEKMKLSNREITRIGVFKPGTLFEAIMDSYDSSLSELNGLKLPRP